MIKNAAELLAHIKLIDYSGLRWRVRESLRRLLECGAAVAALADGQRTKEEDYSLLPLNI